MESVGVVSGENIQIEVSGDSYEHCVSQAMSRLKELIDEDEPVGRTKESLTDNYGWYVAATLGQVTPGGAMISVMVCFVREYA